MKNPTHYRKDSAHPLFYKGCALAMAVSTAFTPTVSSAASPLFPGLIGRTVLPRTIDVNQLPGGFDLKSGLATYTNIDGTMTITQTSDKAIINWSSFDIGRYASVIFKQGSSNSAVLNRIFDVNPSIINGSLTANGKVYLINRNGVFFGPSGSVQVQSLIASAFDISDDNFNSGRLIFKDDHFSDTDPSNPTPISDNTVIQNEGTITTHSGGSVFFVGPRIKNLGRISAPGGKIDLVGLKANGQVEIKEITETRDPQDVIYSDTSLAGDVANMKGGSLYGADGGWIGLHGNTVRNDGLIRAVTTRRQNGVVYLLAKDLVATGQGSDTEVAISDSSEAMGRNALLFSPGAVVFGGLFGTGVNALARIDHEGSITAHSGNVSMEAVERVFLGEQSSIDVSGLNIERPMTDQFIEAQLNSLYLRDDYGQKAGVLSGNTVTVDVLKGSSIGNLSSYYLGMPKNARELSTVGGNVSIGAPNKTDPGTTHNYTLQDIIISTGAGINLSGGSITYSGSAPAASKVIGSDGHVYDISSAPEWLTYSGILGSTVKSYGKFGSEVLSGISFGGHLLKLQTNSTDNLRVVGGNAGSLALKSRAIEGLDDGLNLKASVTTGVYQTLSTPYLDSDKNAATTSPEYQRYIDHLISQNRGLEAPTGGRLVVGNELSNTLGSIVTFTEDAAVNSIVVQKSSPAAATARNWNDTTLIAGDTATKISADMINKAGLSSLSLYANTSILTEKDAGIVLRPGGITWISTGKTDKDGNDILRSSGSYKAASRRIEFLGSVTAPGGSVDMMIRPNITSSGTAQNNPLYRQVAETIFLGSDSRISTAGERIDNSRLGLSPLDIRQGGFTSGGYISLSQVSPAGASGAVLTQNNENSIVIKDGALLDVSGGYLIDQKRAVSGGNAGSLTVKAPTISLGGELRGYSLPGKDGGELVLHAQEVKVVENGKGKQFNAEFDINGTIPNDLVGKLVLGADRFSNSGFSRISLSATDNLTVAAGVQLTPSLIKIDVHNRAATGSGATCSAGSCFSTTYPTFLDQIGKTSLSLNAGTNVYSSANLDPSGNALQNNQQALLTIAQGAAVTTAPGGTISLTAPLIDIAGTVSTSGGNVSATAKYGDLVIRDSGQITAVGYNKTGIATKVGQLAPLPLPKSGGSVSLEATAGNLILESKALVDVSGSERAEGLIRDAHGTLTTVAVAGGAGSLSLAYGTGMTLDGTIAGSGKMTGAQGGSLTIKNRIGNLTLNTKDVDRYQKSGFDALTFSSPTQIGIPTDISLSIGRKLTLDSPLIQGVTGANGQLATIQAPWIKWINSGTLPVPTLDSSIDTGGNKINFIAKYLDLQGSMLLKGFNQVALQAEHDLTFADLYNNDPNVNKWLGALGTTSANLTLQANHIYPTTASSFTITTPGKVTTLPGAANNHDLTPIYSAGGNLTIAAAGGIDHRGFIAAPMGNVTLDSGANGRVELSAGSVITTAGSAPVAYGAYDSSGSAWWSKYVDDNNKGSEVTAAPTKSITLSGNEVVVGNGSIQDLSGGGSVYASHWQSGIPGSKNPLTVTGRYVILPDGSATRPGASVYLEAMPSLGLKAGVYSILPAEYAFVPGALVIQDTGKQLLSGQQTFSNGRYPVVGGYMTVRDTSVASQVLKGFSVRKASDVLAEGDFTTKKSFSGGDGGKFTLNATGGAAYFGGSLNVNALTGYRQGSASFIARNVEVVDSVDTTLPLSDTLQLAGNSISTLNIGELQLGDTTTTREVTVRKLLKGGNLTAAGVTLAATDKVTLNDGALVEATGSGVAIVTPTGNLSMGDGAKITAKSGITLGVKTYSLSNTAALKSGAAGYFSLTADKITFDDASKNFWINTFADNGNLKIASRGGVMDLAFSEADTTLKNSGVLTLDASRFTGMKNVTFESQEMTLLNSGSTYTGASPASAGTVGFSANSITVAPRLIDRDANGNKLTTTKGNIAFDQSVAINSKNDLIFKGAGSITSGGNLNLTAARVTTAGDIFKADGSTTVANITIDGRNGAVTLNGRADGIAGTSSVPGGSLQILGNTITQTGGVLDVAAGRIGLTAIGDISISGTVKATGSEQLSASGEKVYYSGGGITLQSDNGKVYLKGGSKLDVSAAVVTDKTGKVVADTNGAVVRNGNAGSIVLSATTGGVSKAATAQLAGLAGSGGKGGSLSIDSANLNNVGGLDGLSAALAGGGFNNLLNIRSRSGNLELTSGNTLAGREVVVAADNGDISIGKIIDQPDGSKAISAGHINTDTTDGSGRIELYAGNKLTIEQNSTLSVRGTASGANGGTVMLSSQDGSDNTKTFNNDYALNVKSGSTIDVSGNGGAGGTVAFRAYQGKKSAGDTALNDVNMGAVNGTLTGASKVSVEAVQAYSNRTSVGTITGYSNDATAFMTAAATAGAKSRLFGANTIDPVNHLQAGIEISSAAKSDLTVDQTLDLSTVRPGGEAIVLTLKSGNNLNINQSLTDAKTGIDTLYSKTMLNTAAINLVAGSDGGANYMGVAKGSALAKNAAGASTPLAGTGDLTIASGKWIFTENAPIRFAAGNDVTFKGTSTGPNTMINGDMKYNLGSYGGSVRGDVGRDMNLPAVGSAIQTALGNIDIRTGHNLNLGSLANTGAIRTTGEYDNSSLTAKQPGLAADTVANRKSFWTYHNGGSINLDVGNAVDGNLNTANGWDGAYVDSSLYDKNGVPTLVTKNNPWFYLTAGFGGSRESGQTGTANIPVTVGIATMGGGNVSVRSGGTFMAQAGAFGTTNTGNLTVNCGGDMNGRFRVMNGSASLISSGAFGTAANPVVTELAAAKVHVVAMGDVRLASVQNPDNSRDRIYYGSSAPFSDKPWNMTYTEDTSFSATSLSGSATLYGTNPYAGYSATSGYLDTRRLILPASFGLSAAGDIAIEKTFVLAPSKTGNLELFATGSISGIRDNNGITGFRMQDVNLASMYGRQAEDKTGYKHFNQLNGNVHYGINHIYTTTNPLTGDLERQVDSVPVKVSAGKDITDFSLYLNKSAEVTADGNITTLKFVGQNITPNSVTSIVAGGNIDQGLTIDPLDQFGNLQPKTPSIEVGGPGTLLVQAGTRLVQTDGTISGQVGGNIRLGNSGGINSVGNLNNSSFSGSGTDTDSDLIVVAGANGSASMAKQDVTAFFATIRDASDEISTLKADGKTDEVDKLRTETAKTIKKYFYTYDDTKAGVGNLDLVDSAISSRSGSIYAMAGSNLNVGRTSLNNAPLKTSGITTLYGGGLSVYAGGDINVNESRLMTYLSGDITVWSDQGNIYAGRGSKTVVSAPTPVYTFENDVLTNITFTPPSAGSGIRALTFDPDGSGPLSPPEAGVVHIFTPKTLDAGEAGIQGGKLLIAASTVLNSQNITAGIGSVGVPSSSQNTVTIAPISGTSDITSDKKMIESISNSVAATEKKAALTESEDYVMKYLDVKIIDLSNDPI
ncbi:MAG: filamentous hemagglutinin family protein [Desulfuromonadales bacterium]|nr:filamentous hemagglutinin family protein [Desulfuromonadales bacterium]